MTHWHFWRSSAIALSAIVLSACSSPTGSNLTPTTSPTATTTPTTTPAPTEQPIGIARLPNIQSFTRDELFKVGGGGCGMTLSRSDQATNPDQFLFFSGLKTDPAWMKIDGKMVQFKRTGSEGTEFYGQASSQTFTSLDGGIQVEVTVKTGEKGYESVAIQEGTLRFKQGVNDVTLPVQGGAGC